MKSHAGIRQPALQGFIRRILSFPAFLALLWALALLWGERVVFRRSIEQCLWQEWETWVRRPVILKIDLYIY